MAKYIFLKDSVSFVYLFFGLISFSHAENCEILNGPWEVNEHKIDNCGYDFKVVIKRIITVQGENYKADDTLIKSSSIWIWKAASEEGRCSLSGDKLSLNTNYQNIFTTESSFILSPDKMSYTGTFTTQDNCGQHGTISAKRLGAPPKVSRPQSEIKGGGGEARYCIQKEYSSTGESFQLLNTCQKPVNLKYSFSRSKPFSGTYSTLNSGGKTFDQATDDEVYEFYACFAPAVPQTMNGKCFR